VSDICAAASSDYLQVLVLLRGCCVSCVRLVSSKCRAEMVNAEA
jgi:hypothetical protein